MLVSCAWLIKDGTKLGDISIAQIQDYLHRPHCFVWVALNEPTPTNSPNCKNCFGLHPLAVEDALVGHQRPKVEEYGDGLFAVLHLVEPATVMSITLVNSPSLQGLSTSCRCAARAQKVPPEVRARCERELQLLRRGPGFVLYALTVLRWSDPLLPDSRWAGG